MSAMDMQTAVYPYGSPEMALLSAGYTEITKWMRVPEYETAGCSDAKCFDEQACMEAAINISTAAMVGGNMIHDIGYIEQGLCSSPHMLVASDEMISRSKRILRGIPVNADTQALDVLDEVGPGGHFLGHDHTFNRFKTENWRSSLSRPAGLRRLGSGGSKDYQQRVHERMVEILEADTAPLLEPKMYQELRRICELADARHKDEELDVKMFV